MTSERIKNMKIGEKIKELRKKNGLTQERLADYLCVSYQAVSKWETGTASPDLSLIAPLTKEFENYLCREDFDFLRGNERFQRLLR